MDLPVQLKKGNGGFLVRDEHSHPVLFPKAWIRDDLSGDHEAVIVDEKSNFGREFHKEAALGGMAGSAGIDLIPGIVVLNRGIIILI